MREILFRGKTEEGEWVYGTPVRQEEDDYIMVGLLDERDSPLDMWRYSDYVISNTIGQYTGLTDNNGKRIFEGDIIKSREYGDTYSVKYFADVDYPAFDCEPEIEGCECNGLSYLMNTDFVEVIGNIHDNPELLKGDQNEQICNKQ